MSNLAAILPSPKTSLEVHPVPVYVPGPREILIKNECIALNAIEAKIAIHNVIPYTPYLAILGSTYAGTIASLGPSTPPSLAIGDRVVVSKRFDVKGNQHGAFQRFVICTDIMVSRVPDAIDLSVPASLFMNLTCVVGLFSGRLGLERPQLDGGVVEDRDQKKKVLVYGGSGSFGGLSVGYLSQAGYAVVTTSSPPNRAFVEGLGATAIVDHTQDAQGLIEQLVEKGPYDIVVDFVSVASTLAVTGRVVEAQGGGRLFTMQPGREELPAGVERVFEPYSESLYEKRNRGLQRWVVEEYLPLGIARGLIKPLPIEKVGGGLKGLNEGLRKVLEGGSGARYVVDPWE
ncbi:GroES-like protein [Paraphaeosphaeria sporulosa]|uniref:GroES-like protein n=1 Tax=Paraphaeosphaeria sporulosa TaxID=1460663 RepID=A0A177C5Y1_9PLEO|nr:GroES-like protein [Paraphaeosphaeria sporulosa]OAG02137.1 GroES-like protein [Paraphaeosphaeria sporulosa]